MVAPNINDTILVLVEPPLSRSSSFQLDQEQPPPFRRRISNRTVITRASLKGISPDTVSVLKEAFESWGKDNASNFVDLKSQKRTDRSSVTLQRIARGWSARRRTCIMKLERKLRSIRSQTQHEVAMIHQEKMMRMQEIKQQVEFEHRMENEGRDNTVNEAKKIVDQLRQENQTIRIQNNEICLNLLKLKIRNERLENAQQRAESSILEISQHIEDMKHRVAEHKQEEALLIDELNTTLESTEALNELRLAEQNNLHLYEQTTTLILDALRERQGTCCSDLRNELVHVLLKHKEAFTT